MRLTANELELIARYMRHMELTEIFVQTAGMLLSNARQWDAHERDLASRFPQDTRRVAAS